MHHVREMEGHVRLIQPTRIYMQIGGNDLDSVDISYEYTTSIVKKVISVCRRILTKYNVQDVVIGQFYRVMKHSIVMLLFTMKES